MFYYRFFRSLSENTKVKQLLQESRTVARKPRDAATVCFGLKLADIDFKFKTVVTCKIKHLQKCCKMSECFIIRVTTYKIFLKCFTLKTFAKMLQNIRKSFLQMF